METYVQSRRIIAISIVVAALGYFVDIYDLLLFGTGVPLWFIVGILMTLAPELGRALRMEDLPTAGKAIMYCYIGLAIGDFASGLISQLLRSRKKAVLRFLLFTAAMVALYLLHPDPTLGFFYITCLLLGIGAGYWAIFVTVASKQFGTNIRATVTTTVPNFVRGSVIPLTLAYQALTPATGEITSAAIVGAGSFLIAFVALGRLQETYGRDLNYMEV